MKSPNYRRQSLKSSNFIRFSSHRKISLCCCEKSSRREKNFPRGLKTFWWLKWWTESWQWTRQKWRIPSRKLWSFWAFPYGISPESHKLWNKPNWDRPAVSSTTIHVSFYVDLFLNVQHSINNFITIFGLLLLGHCVNHVKDAHNADTTQDDSRSEKHLVQRSA